MQRHPLGQCPLGLLATDAFGVTDLLGEVEGGLVGHVALQYIENEAFFDGLAHRDTGGTAVAGWSWMPGVTDRQDGRTA